MPSTNKTPLINGFKLVIVRIRVDLPELRAANHEHLPRFYVKVYVVKYMQFLDTL
jgi:hypothetical protein